MEANVLGFQEVDMSKIQIAGGKGANLGELYKINGVNVPEGFCVTTHAYKAVTDGNETLENLLDELARVDATEGRHITDVSAKIRAVIEMATIPANIISEITAYLEKFDEDTAFAVRSSATAEDLPTASFAGQQDTYLNVIGDAAILNHISKCWASLFTERAIIYRLRNGFDHRKVQLSVVVQQMVFSDASGILFTADPINGNRKVLSIDAGFGLGEAIVSGLVNPDNYKVSNGEIISKRLSDKNLSIRASENGGVEQQLIEHEHRNRQALTDGQILQLERIGRKIEEHFNCPQDIEWCLANDEVYIVQSRPITTLYPVPEARDGENHVYVSVGHQQMMTDAMKPLGLSFFLVTTPALMRTAGGRLFVDVTPMLASASGRHTLINVLGKSDPIIKEALTTFLNRQGFVKPLPDDKDVAEPGKAGSPGSPPNYQALNDYDPSIVEELIKTSQASIETLQQAIKTKSGGVLFDFILEDIQQRKKANAESPSFGVIMTGMNATSWINEKMNEWLGEKNAADVLAQSVPHNVTSEMGLELLNVADVVRRYPEIVNFLQQVKNDNFLQELDRFKGSEETRDAIQAYLNKYGMRCAGEIDITRPRWAEKPAILVPLILNNIKNMEPGAAGRKFEEGRLEAEKKEQELLNRLKQLPGSEQKIKETKRMINMVRNFSGYREYPKYGIVSRYFVYKQALLQEAERLVSAGVIRDKEDIYYLSFEELREAVISRKLDYEVIDNRKNDYKLFEKLSPPRVMTSDGEKITGRYNNEKLPPGAIAGLAVSSGIIEGRARVILNMEEAELEDGDILVTAFTDPSWTPLFVAIKGLVTEVGGLMTHGAVIAREYGLPAVVGVEDATWLIKDRQQIKVNGTDGYIELL